MFFLENAVGYFVNCVNFQTFVIVFSTPGNLLVGISLELIKWK